MDKGFILLSRNILESEVFASQKLLKIWIWCLCKSNFKDRNVPLKIGRGETIVKVDRGSFIFGRHKAEEELFIDGSTIYKSMKQLEKLEMISITSNNQYSIVKVNKYNDYQDTYSYKVTTKEQPKNNQVTAEGQPSNTTNTLKQVNKDNNVKEDINTATPFSFFNSLISLGANKDLVNDWLKVRKTKKLTNTKTAFDSFVSQLEKSKKDINFILKECVVNSWGGFKSEWLTKEVSSPTKRRVIS